MYFLRVVQLSEQDGDFIVAVIDDLPLEAGLAEDTEILSQQLGEAFYQLVVIVIVIRQVVLSVQDEVVFGLVKVVQANYQLLRVTQILLLGEFAALLD